MAQTKGAVRMKKRSWLWWAVTLAVVAGAFFWRLSGAQSGTSTPAAGGSFTVQYLDVGQGDSELVQCDGHYMLIDGGTSAYSDKIYATLQKQNISHLDYIVNTHPHEDHVGGLSGALQIASVGKALSPVKSYDNDSFKDFKKYLKKQGVTITVPSPGDTFALGSANVTVLGPIEDSDDPNDLSIVLRVVYGDTSFLFVGDAQTSEENDILASGRTVKSDVLKVGHHGSETSTGADFLTAVAPQYAVIEVGDSNSYNHPNQGTLDRLKAAGVTLYRTDLQGTVTCTSDGKTLTFKTEKTAASDVFTKKEES